MPTYLIKATPLSMKTLCTGYWDHDVHAIIDGIFKSNFLKHTCTVPNNKVNIQLNYKIAQNMSLECKAFHLGK